MFGDRPDILIIDDEPGMRLLVSRHLEQEGYRVAAAASGREGLARLDRQPPDLVLLDVAMPDRDGFETLQQLRAFSQVPVILLTGRGSYMEKVRGLDLGADDFLTKPFNLVELSARIRAVLRRTRPAAAARGMGHSRPTRYALDLEQRRAQVDGREVRLSPTEWSLLAQLSASPGRIVPVEELLPLVGHADQRAHDQHLRVWISRLRHKLGDDPARPRLIRTVPKLGYQLLADRATPAASQAS